MTVRINMATSLDGKIAPAKHGKVRLGTDEDIRRMQVLRAWADAVVIGAGTVRAEDPPMEITGEALIADRRRAGRGEQPAVVVVSGSLDIPVGRTFRGSGRHILATVEESAEPSRELAAACEVWRLGTGRVDCTALVQRLRAEGLQDILVEGGGGVAAGFFEAGLVDEIRLTLTPWLIGGEEAPAVAESREPLEPPPVFAFSEVEAREDEVFLTLRRRQGDG